MRNSNIPQKPVESGAPPGGRFADIMGFWDGVHLLRHQSGRSAAQGEKHRDGSECFRRSGFIPQPAQDAEVSQLAENGVKTIRTGLGANSIYFITRAFQRGIGSVVIVYPFFMVRRPGRKGHGRKYPCRKSSRRNSGNGLNRCSTNWRRKRGVRLAAIASAMRSTHGDSTVISPRRARDVYWE